MWEKIEFLVMDKDFYSPKDKPFWQKADIKEFEDTKKVIRIRISKKNRQHNG